MPPAGIMKFLCKRGRESFFCSTVETLKQLKEQYLITEDDYQRKKQTLT